jgi:hypothetical protein
MSQEVAVPGESSVVLDEHAALVKEEEFLRDTVKAWEQKLKEVRAKIQALMGDAEVGIFAGQPTYRWKYIDGMNKTEFRKKYPAMARAYTHVVEREEIDVALLRTAQPDIFKEFQTRRFERI